MKTLRAIVLLSLAACGGLENEPLTLGVIRGTLLGGSAASTVAIFNQQQFVAPVDAAGRFELRGVPRGSVELLTMNTLVLGERIPVDVVGGEVADLGERKGRPAGLVELELKSPGFQRVDKGSVMVAGTPFSIKLEEPGEWVFHLPAGCYRVEGSVPGLGTKQVEACVAENARREVHIEFPAPDGSAGREGCRVTGCLYNLACHADGSCGL